MSKRNETIEVPKRVMDSMVEAYEKWEEFSNELEDFVISTDPTFIQKMRKARQEHKKGKTRPLSELMREL